MVTFFFDNDISFRIVNALKSLVPPTECQLLALRDIFPVEAKDTEWTPHVGRQGWIVISRDHNQRRRDAEHRALVANQVRALYIRQSGKALELYPDAARIIKNWPKIQEWGVKAQPSTLAKLDSHDIIVHL